MSEVRASFLGVGVFLCAPEMLQFGVLQVVFQDFVLSLCCIAI